jgi:hypothetical protein
MISCANHVLYGGKSWKSMTPETIRDHLQPYMWTKIRATEENPFQMVEPEAQADVIEPSSFIEQTIPIVSTNTVEANVKEGVPIAIANAIESSVKPAHRLHSQEHSLFWSLFIAVYGYGVYAREQNNKPWNTRIDERVRIVESLKATPRRLKDCNHKLTLDQIQALFSTLMTSPHDSIDQLIVFSIYYSRPIVVMYDSIHAKHVFLPSLASVLDEDVSDAAIYLLATPSSTNNRMQYAYLLDRESIQSRRNYFLLENIKDGGLRALSSYKVADLQSIADQIHLDIQTTKKKEDLYHAIKMYFKQHLFL